MTRSPVTVPAGASIGTAAQVMAQNKCGFLPVIENGVAIGVVTGLDLATRVAARGLSLEGIPVRAIMSGPSISISAEADIEDAGLLMRERDIRRLVVTGEDGQIVGVVSLADLAGYASDESIARTLRRHADKAPPGPSHEYVFSIPGRYAG